MLQDFKFVFYIIIIIYVFFMGVALFESSDVLFNKMFCLIYGDISPLFGVTFYNDGNRFRRISNT